MFPESANRSRYASPTPTSSSVMNGSLDALIPPVAPIASAYFVPEPSRKIDESVVYSRLNCLFLAQLEPSESLSPFCTSEVSVYPYTRIIVVFTLILFSFKESHGRITTASNSTD